MHRRIRFFWRSKCKVLVDQRVLAWEYPFALDFSGILLEVPLGGLAFS